VKIFIILSFAKWPDCYPDPLHTYMGLCGLSLVHYPSLEPIHPALVITARAHEHLKTLHKTWENNN
jgi:geranylgeranyl transferase type-1 subunit beta